MQKARRGLEELLGHDVLVEPEWQVLLAELESYYPDRGHLVAVVAGLVEAWCVSLSELLVDDEAHGPWAEALLERLKASARLRLFLDVATGSCSGFGSGSGLGGEGPTTSWSEDRSAFVLGLPRKTVSNPAEFYPVFRGELLACFDEKRHEHAAAAAAAADDWADVEINQASGSLT